MELKEPRAKRQKLKHADKYTSKTKITGFFNGFCVVLEVTKDAQAIINAESFGKGSLSRGLPTTSNSPLNSSIIRRRQFDRRKNWAQKYPSKKVKKVIVMPDSDSENEDYFENTKPEYQLDSSGFEETINLTMTESFFLMEYRKSLEIVHLNEIMNVQKCWQTFCAADFHFVQDYICYHHFKSKNWVVKPAVKFGGDYLLYKDGPAYYHASYVVIIDVVDEESFQRRKDMCKRAMDVPNIIGLNRLCETMGKELLIFQILWPKNVTVPSNTDIHKFKVKEILMRRWDPNTERAIKTT